MHLHTLACSDLRISQPSETPGVRNLPNLFSPIYLVPKRDVVFIGLEGPVKVAPIPALLLHKWSSGWSSMGFPQLVWRTKRHQHGPDVATPQASPIRSGSCLPPPMHMISYTSKVSRPIFTSCSSHPCCTPLARVSHRPLNSAQHAMPCLVSHAHLEGQRAHVQQLLQPGAQALAVQVDQVLVACMLRHGNLAYLQGVRSNIGWAQLWHSFDTCLASVKHRFSTARETWMLRKPLHMDWASCSAPWHIVMSRWSAHMPQ